MKSLFWPCAPCMHPGRGHRRRRGRRRSPSPTRAVTTRAAGNYTIPDRRCLQAGSFDITGFSAVAEQGGTESSFQVEVAAGPGRPLGHGRGLQRTQAMVFIVIKTGPGGYTDAPPGLNIQFDGRRVEQARDPVSPQKKARVTAEAESKASKFPRTSWCRT